MGANSSQKATAYRMVVDPDNTGLWKVKQTEEVARTASELLQEDIEKHHVFFNERRFHNHIPHHILSLYGTGAPSSSLRLAYQGNAHYQRPVLPEHDPNDNSGAATHGDANIINGRGAANHHPDSGTGGVQLLQHGFSISTSVYFGKEEYYPDLLHFFQRAIEVKGWQAVLQEYVFSGEPAADDLFERLFEGFLHPMIQLMYGVEFEQPAIVAEGLAQAAVHGHKLRGFLTGAEERMFAMHRGDKGEQGTGTAHTMPSIVSLYEAVAKAPNLGQAVKKAAADPQDDNMGVEAVLRGDSMKELLDIAARVRVDPSEVEERTAEMCDAVMYMASCAAREHPEKYPKFDFFLMHHCNVCPIFLALNAQPWLTDKQKARILEWKMRMDLLQYAARACPPLDVGKIASYKPKDAVEKTPAEIVSRLHNLEEDGHAIKLGRAAGIFHQLLKKYEDKEWMKIKGDEMWMKVQNLVVDSVEAPGSHWVRTTGLEEAWQDIPNVADAKL